jgi:hypothetical protein
LAPEARDNGDSPKWLDMPAETFVTLVVTAYGLYFVFLLCRVATTYPLTAGFVIYIALLLFVWVDYMADRSFGRLLRGHILTTGVFAPLLLLAFRQLLQG